MRAPRVEVVWWRGCPSTDRALAELREEMSALGLDAAAVQIREIEDDEQAERERFPGSPTLLVDGRDVQPPPPDTPVGLTCRLYRLRDGRPSPVPDRADVRDALTAAITSERSMG